MFTASNTCKRYIDEGAEICTANFSNHDAHERKRKQTSYCGDFQRPSKPIREMLSKILQWWNPVMMGNGQALILLPSYHWLKDVHKNMPKVEGERILDGECQTNVLYTLRQPSSIPQRIQYYIISLFELKTTCCFQQTKPNLIYVTSQVEPHERNGYLRKVSY